MPTTVQLFHFHPGINQIISYGAQDVWWKGEKQRSYFRKPGKYVGKNNFYRTLGASRTLRASRASLAAKREAVKADAGL